MKIIEIANNDLKQEICRNVLRDLPEWFGIEEATEYYINAVTKYPFIAVYIDNEAIGFYSLREENSDTLDMYVLGIKKKYHHQGIGTKLQSYVEEYAKTKGYKYLMVLTLSSSHKDLNYKLTRDFYHKYGFVDIFESNKIWDESNPTQIMIKKIWIYGIIELQYV